MTITDDLDTILTSISLVTGVDKKDIVSKKRVGDIPLYRQMATKMLVDRKYTQKDIYKLLAYEDRSSISLNVKSITSILSIDKRVAGVYESVEKMYSHLNSAKQSDIYKELLLLQAMSNQVSSRIEKLIKYVESGRSEESSDTK